MPAGAKAGALERKRTSPGGAVSTRLLTWNGAVPVNSAEWGEFSSTLPNGIADVLTMRSRCDAGRYQLRKPPWIVQRDIHG
jgi:hypothetical protein